MVVVTAVAAVAGRSCSSFLARFALRPTPTTSRRALPIAGAAGRRTFSETVGHTYGAAHQQDRRSPGSSSSAAPSSQSAPSSSGDANTAGASSRTSARPPPAGYVSPYQDLFDRMHANGPTILGSTDRVVELERKILANSRKLECGIPEAELRFSTTSWGRVEKAPYVMTKEHQVTVKVHTDAVPLSKREMEILREIVGNRLNDERREVRLSSNKFGSRIENKRHVVSMLDRIICSCQRLGKTLPDGTSNNNNAEEETTGKETASSFKQTANVKSAE